ncbi:hypothetical protein [Mycolicibacterium sp. XJ1819]
MRLDRRWWLAIGVAVVAVVALGYSILRQPPEECGPVQDLLDFNRSQGELIGSKGGDGLVSEAEETAYREWADGLAERAHQVDNPDLAGTSAQVADLADQFVDKLHRLRAETQARAPGAPAPPVLYEMSALNDQISHKLAELADACSG